MAVQAITQKSFLTLLQEAVAEAGVQQATPSSVDDTAGLVPDFKRFLQQAFIDIQSERPWNWRRSKLEFTLATGADTYDLQTNDNADVNGLLEHVAATSDPYILIRVLEVAEETSSTEAQGRCYYIPYSEWRGEQKRLVDKDAGIPTYFTVAPNNIIEFNRPADDDYGCDIDYLTEVVEMTADADLPTIPIKYQDMLIWLAVMYYHGWDETNMEQRAVRRYLRLRKRMEREQLPPIRLRAVALYDDRLGD